MNFEPHPRLRPSVSSHGSVPHSARAFRSKHQPHLAEAMGFDGRGGNRLSTYQDTPWDWNTCRPIDSLTSQTANVCIYDSPMERLGDPHLFSASARLGPTDSGADSVEHIRCTSEFSQWIHTHTLHVCHICLHWGGFRGQCRHIWHTWSVWDRQGSQAIRRSICFSGVVPYLAGPKPEAPFPLGVLGCHGVPRTFSGRNLEPA